MLNNCWKVLGIPPTNDIEAIKKAYRSLIKKWHPDTVHDPQRRQEYTDRSAAINVAYDDAIRRAEGWTPGLSPEMASSGARRSSTRAYRYSVNFKLDPIYLLWLGFVLVLLAFAALVFFRSVVDFLTGLVLAALLNYLLSILFIRPMFYAGSTGRFLNDRLTEHLRHLILFFCDVLAVWLWFSESGLIFNVAIISAVPIRLLWRLW